MQKIMMALAAVSLTVPALPQQASARERHHHQHSQYYNGQYYNGQVWKDSRGRLRCKRPNGTTGLIIGAAGGALVGRAIDTHGERATGTILGAAAGALLGRSIERSRVRCR